MADIYTTAFPTPTPPMMPGASLHPWFDQPAPILGVLGIPWWFIILCGVALVFILVHVSWLFRMKRMAAVKGFKEIQKKAGPDDVMVWLLTKTQRTIIECLKYSGSVASYYNPLRLSMWHLSSPMAMVHVGGYPAMLASDDYDQSRDPVAEIAITTACEELNGDPKIWDWINNRVKEMAERGDAVPKWLVENATKPIESFTDYKERGRFLLKMKYPDGIPIPAYSIFNPMKFRKYFPKGRDATFFGAVITRKSKKMKDNLPEKGFWDKILPIAVPLVIGIIAIVGAWAVPLGK